MAHNIKIEPRPYRKADGTYSETRTEYLIIDRHRGKRVVVGVAKSQKDIKRIVSEHREKIFEAHLQNHPNDKAFREKHKEILDV